MIADGGRPPYAHAPGVGSRADRRQEPARGWLGARAALVGLALLAGVMLSALVPSFQSPDEFEHVKRAYLLGHGKILLRHPEGGSSGGFVDDGLLDYMALFGHLPFQEAARLTQDDARLAGRIEWRGERTFSEAAGAAYYFPGIYLPQAAGLRIGEALGLSVDRSYRLARFAAYATSLAVIVLAFSLFAPNGFVVALLILPMSLFQFASASIDGLALALALLAVALFLRGAERSAAPPAWMPYVLAGCVVLLATSRPHLLPLVLLPLFLFARRRSRATLWALLAAALLSLGWLALAMATTVDLRLGRPVTTGEVGRYYLQRPLEMLRVLADTWGDPAIRGYYQRSFIGILGWLDTHLPAWFYRYSMAVLLALALLSVSVRTLRADGYARIALLLVALGCTFMVFLALLLTWTPHPAATVSGVQGRYFLIPVVLAGYALSGCARPLYGRRAVLALPLLVVYALTAAHVMPQVLVARYHATASAAAAPACDGCALVPSARLAPGAPIRLSLAPQQFGEPGELRAVEILFATHRENLQGEAELALRTADGRATVRRFSLRGTRDNAYRLFVLDGGHYVEGELRAVSGGGVSVWESHDGDGNVRTCVIYTYASRERRHTAGCPLEGQ